MDCLCTRTERVWLLLLLGSAHHDWQLVNKQIRMLRKRQLVDSNEPSLSDYDYTPKLDHGYLQSIDNSSELKVYNEEETKPLSWFWNTLFVVLGFATRYYRIWAGDFVL